MPSNIKYILLTLLIFFIFPQRVNGQVLINEFLANPVDENQEWVEFINTYPNEINLASYYFDDDTDFNNETGSDKFILSGILVSGGLCYVQISSYLNNTADSPTIFNVNGLIEDTYSYTKTTEELTFSRIPDGGTWQSDQTNTKTSVSCLSLAPTPPPSPTPTPTNSPTTSPTQAPTTSPTKSPTPIPTPVKTASLKPITPKPTSTESGQAEESLVLEPQVLSLSTVASSAEPKTTGKNKSPILAILLVFSGVCFLGYGGYMLYNQTYENKTNTN